MILNSISAYIDLIERIIEFVERVNRKKKISKAPLGDTLLKVESAHEHLTDAIEAIDLIREQAISERTRLDALLSEVEQKRNEYNEATKDLEITQDLLNRDREKLQSSLGINTTREKLIGFISGVVASIFATAIWVLGPKLWRWVQTLMS